MGISPRWEATGCFRGIKSDFNPSAGHEPAKMRPAVVVTAYGFNARSSLVGVVPIQSRDTGYPLHVFAECLICGRRRSACEGPVS